MRFVIFNFYRFTLELHIDDFVFNPGIYPYRCKGCPFIDKNRKHILSADLQFTEDNKLRKVLCKGTKFRKKKKIDFGKARACIFEGVERGSI